MSTRHSTTETAEQKLSRLQEESERANQKAVEMAKAVADAKAESEAEAKRVLEEKTAIEAKKKLEAKRKAETKRKSLKKGPDDDYEAGSSSKALRRAADGDSGSVVSVFLPVFMTSVFQNSEAEEIVDQDASNSSR